jgi:predicted RNase H-like HicB family nuclease
MTAYIGLLRKDPNSNYGVDFPDFPGCVTAGRTLDDARRMAAEALAFHIEGMRADGDEIPAPSSLETIMADRRNKGAVAVLVDVPDQPERAIRINVSLPEDLVRSIDQVAANRSRFLAAAARDRLRRQRKLA